MDLPPHGDRPDWRTQTHVRHAVHPRDLLDGLVCLAAGAAALALTAVLAAVPAAAVYLATRSGYAATGALVAAGLLAACMVTLTLVHWMRIDATGLRLGRLAGWPKSVRWEDVTGIRPASRSEVIVRGWLLPPVPPREATRCLSSLGHYRIDYRGGYFFYPPADEERFLKAVAFWRARHAEQHGPGDSAAGGPGR